MGTTLNASFETRREAEMTVERLVQELAIDRTDIFITAAGDRNTAGEDRAGSDAASGSPTTQARTDAPLNGAVMVSVDIDDEARIAAVRDAFAEFAASDIGKV